MKRIATVLLTLALTAGAAQAGPAGDTLRGHLYAGTLAQGLEALRPLAASDAEAQFGVGVLELVGGVEHLAQALYRHGLTTPDAGAFSPGTLLPVPVNPNPERYDYQGVRATLQTLVDDLDAARADFEKAAAAGDYVVEINPLEIRIDINGDGKVEDSESIAGMLGMVMGAPADAFSDPHVLTRHLVGFDRADAWWLAGYSDVLAAQADFLLAHDFSDFVNVLFHRIFPKAGFPMQAYGGGTGTLMFEPNTDGAIADAVAAIHTLNWPVIEPERLRGVRARLKAVTAYSRQNWDAILAETDDNHELVPSPRQTALVPDAKVTDEMVAAWRKTLDVADTILEGQLLVPHWRFRLGFDLKAYFETATRTDLVMILTGYGAIPFLHEGPVATPEDFREAQQAFGSNWLGYAFWFN